MFCDVDWIYDKVRHVNTICRFAFVNLTDQIGPELVEMSAKTGTYEKTMTQCFVFLLTDETKGTICVFFTMESLHSAQDSPLI